MSECTSYDLIEWGKPFEKCQNHLPEPKGAEVLVRVTAAGLCRSDLHVQKGYMDLGEEGRLTFAERGAVLPMTFGHEVAGIVEADGPRSKFGQTRSAGSGVPLDRLRRMRGLPGRQGKRLHGNAHHRAESRRVVSLRIAWWSTRSSSSILRAWMRPMSCRIPARASPSTTLSKRWGRCERANGWRSLGCGGLGMNAISIARAMGFENVIAVDIDDAKLDAARDMGATKVMNSQRDDAVSELQKLADGRLMGVLRHVWRRVPPGASP